MDIFNCSGTHSIIFVKHSRYVTHFFIVLSQRNDLCVRCFDICNLLNLFPLQVNFLLWMNCWIVGLLASFLQVHGLRLLWSLLLNIKFYWIYFIEYREEWMIEYQVFGVLSRPVSSVVRRIILTLLILLNFTTPYQTSQPFFWPSLVLSML